MTQPTSNSYVIKGEVQKHGKAARSPKPSPSPTEGSYDYTKALTQLALYTAALMQQQQHQQSSQQSTGMFPPASSGQRLNFTQSPLTRTNTQLNPLQGPGPLMASVPTQGIPQQQGFTASLRMPTFTSDISQSMSDAVGTTGRPAYPVAPQGQQQVQNGGQGYPSSTAQALPALDGLTLKQAVQELKALPMDRYANVQKADRLRQGLLSHLEANPQDAQALLAQAPPPVPPQQNQPNQSYPFTRNMFFPTPDTKIPSPNLADKAYYKRFEENKIQMETLYYLFGEYPPMNRDGYIIIGDQAYGREEVVAKAREYVAHLRKTGKPLPLAYPTTPPTEADLRNPTKKYTDVTNKVYKSVTGIFQDIHDTPVGQRWVYFKNTFDNNFSNDLQVNHGLPGQVVVRDPKTGKFMRDPQNPNFVLTIDQRGIFNGQIVPAAYISNYVFGLCMAEAGYPEIAIPVIMTYLKVKEGKFTPDPQIPFAIEGYRDLARVKKYHIK